MNKTTDRNKTFFDTYIGQGHQLPQGVKDLVEEKIDLYAFVDLNAKLQFCEQWVVLTEKNLIVFQGSSGRYKKQTAFCLSKLAKIKEVNSLSSTSLILIEADDLPALLVLRYTHRQKIILGHLKYLLESKIENDQMVFSADFDADVEYQQSVLKPVFEAQNSITSDNAGTFRRLLSYLGPYKKELGLGMTGAVLTTMVSMVPPFISGRLIDTVIKPFQNGGLSFERASMSAWILVAGLGASYLLREFFIWVRLKKMSILGEKVASDLRDDLFTHLQTLSMDFYSRKNTGSIITRVSSDTDRIWDFIAFGVVEVSIAIISLLTLSSVLIALDWRLGVLMSAPVPILLFAIYRHGEKMKRMFIKAWRKWSDLTSLLSDTIPGIQVVKAFNQEKLEVKKFKNRNKIVTSEFNNIHQAWTGFWPLLMLGIHLIIMSVWFLAIPRLINQGENLNQLSVGTFVSFLLYMTMFSQPIEVIGQVARMLNRALSSAYRIFEILDTNPTITNSQSANENVEVKGRVQFENVYFSYDGVRHILKGINFDVKPGEMIGLVGTSGGGKSTITKLIARFYDVSSGEIRIDGMSLKELEVGNYRKQVGMVLQDPYLFQGTIWENIAYGVQGIGKKEVIEAARVANAHDFITNLTHGYDTIVGEKGHTLSGGERQRVSIARAILADPKILILDEATSAVDTETERKIQDALDKLIEGRTVFAVAHRLSTLRQANRIFVIGKGKILESGTHQDLLSRKDGEYYKLHKMQQEMSEFFAL